MNYIENIILGLIQGLTEFFPISSSGHLLIGKILLGVGSSHILIDIFLHMGTLVSIIIFWRKDILTDFIRLSPNKNHLIIKLIIGSLPAGMIGYFFHTDIEKLFNTSINDLYFPYYIIINYFIMFMLLFISKNYQNNKLNDISFKHALLIGIAQSIALMPGISRSGITIVMSLILGYSFKESVKYSFYLAIPIIVFAGLNTIYSYNHLLYNDNILLVSLIIGFISSSLFGYLILIILIKYISNTRYWYFSFYCLIISIILLLYIYVN